MSNGLTRNLIINTVKSFCNKSPDFSIQDNGVQELINVFPKSVEIEVVYKDPTEWLDPINYNVVITVWGEMTITSKTALTNDMRKFMSEVETEVKQALVLKKDTDNKAKKAIREAKKALKLSLAHELPEIEINQDDLIESAYYEYERYMA